MESKRQPKKLIISSYDSINNPYYGGGGAVCVHEIYKRLKNEYSVKVIAGSFPGSREKLNKNSGYSFTGISLFGPKLGHIFYRFAIIFRSMIEDYDIWIECSSPPFTFSLLPLFAKGPVVSWVHMFSGAEMARRYKIPFHFVEKFLARNYKYFIVLSKWMKDKTINDFGAKPTRIAIIPNGTTIKKTVFREKNYFLFLGRLDISQKGIDLLISAFAKMPPDNGVSLVVAGGGTEKTLNDLNDIISSEGLTKRIRLVGKVGGLKKDKLLSECLALVLPSRFDTYPLTVLEAFAHSKPVILFDLPQLSWVPSGVSVKVRPFDVNLYSNALSKLAGSSSLRVKLGRKSLVYVQNYSWDNVYRMFEKFIKNI